ncbi:hypothetical protein SAMN05446037_1007170 [Anaerovirgula multivorans]|uniref:Uncharacterized protein n=1 Tax=Anaerovirgula multivorans TaxID=312168 RepID=A0A239DIL6_9FIRM|nr:hypothetical protein [Anaerovirgula multivorans]SNS31494.1 hypothetical protein SAMN05446037_1007170 [Anaerovirgula multivorans]
MSKKEKELIETLDKKLDQKLMRTLTICALVMIGSALMHDGDHIRQALNWGYSIPLSLWVLNLTVYILPVVSLFLIRMGRFSATVVTGIAGIFISASFLMLHLLGSATGLWGVWNYSYFDLMKGVTYQGVYYQGVDWISWVCLFEVPVLSIPGSVIAFRKFVDLKKK